MAQLQRLSNELNRDLRQRGQQNYVQADDTEARGAGFSRTGEVKRVPVRHLHRFRKQIVERKSDDDAE